MTDAEFFIAAAEEEACEVIEQAVKDAALYGGGRSALENQIRLVMMHLQGFLEDLLSMEYNELTAVRSVIPIPARGGAGYAAAAKAAE